MTNATDTRLPLAVRPLRYELTIEPDLDSCVFTGSAAVSVVVDEPTSEVVLNARDLHISAAQFEQDGATLDGTVTLDAAVERVNVRLPREVGTGPATLHFTFAGKLHDDLVGFYRSRYTGEDG